MSKYKLLWEYIQTHTENRFIMTFVDIEKAAGIPLDHSFLNAKNECIEYGYRVEKISLKSQTICFTKVKQGTMF